MKLTAEQKIEFALEVQRELCRQDFYSFCKYMDSKFFTPGKPHLKLIAEALQEIADGVIKKLAISLPPRAGKSYITSLFCAWLLGKHQEGSIMRNSYAAKLAEKFSKDIRDGIIPSEKYQNIFNINISSKSSAVDGWSLEGHTQTAYFCAGVGGAITGFGCKTVAILDDSIKNIEEALSEITVEATWNWYTSTHLSRLEVDCPEIHIATRWTRHDCIGRLTDEFSPEYDPDYRVINIPALDEYGKSFCDEVHTTAEYMAIKKVTDEFIFEAEYMQHPVESKGLLFSSEVLKRFTLEELKTTDKDGNRVNKKPDGTLGFTDTADRGADFLCSPIGKKFGLYTYITDVVFTQDGVEITEPLVAQMCIDTKCDIMKIESNNGGTAFARNIRSLIRGKSPCMVIDEVTTSNKETRILMNAGYIKEYFYFRSDYVVGSDYDKFMRYLTSYVKMGNNKHDDAPDAVTGLAEYVKYKTYSAPQEKPTYNFNSERPGVNFFDSVEATESYINGGW
jgi:predicted phage terminase large subunit-like protein